MLKCTWEVLIDLMTKVKFARLNELSDMNIGNVCSLNDRLVQHQIITDPDLPKMSHDIALIEMDCEIAFTNMKQPVTLAQLPTESPRNFPETTVYVAGWGLTIRMFFHNYIPATEKHRGTPRRFCRNYSYV